MEALIVVAGLAITDGALRSHQDAVETISQPEDVPEADVDVSLMFWFSAANLVLDFVNVGCFARAHQAFGLTSVRREAAPTSYSLRGLPESERTSLLMPPPLTPLSPPVSRRSSSGGSTEAGSGSGDDFR